MAENFVGEVGQKALIERDGKVLLCCGLGNDGWDIPGGRLQKDEEPSAGLRRELKEELGVDAIVHEPLSTSLYLRKDGISRFFVVYRVSLPDDAELVFPPEELSELRWATKNEALALDIAPAWKEVFRKHLS